MMFEEARRRMLGAGYQLLPVQGEPLYVVFWPMDSQGRRRTEALSVEQICYIGEQLPEADEVRVPVIDIRHVGVIGRLRKMPASTDAEGVPKLALVIEFEGKPAVNSLPIDELRDMLGELVLLQLNAVQLRFQLERQHA